MTRRQHDARDASTLVESVHVALGERLGGRVEVHRLIAVHLEERTPVVRVGLSRPAPRASGLAWARDAVARASGFRM